MSIVYRPIGSGAGVRALESGNADFAASDYPPPQVMQDKLHVRLIATVLGGAVPVYNIPALRTELRFTPELLASIYLGNVTRWDDRAIRVLNRNAKLPGQKIVVVHRSDSSGTSYVWTDFLSLRSAEWKQKVGVGAQPAWPVGESAPGNEGVAQKVSATPFSIGYVEFLYALQSHLAYGSVQNAAGQFVSASNDSLSAAAGAAKGDIGGGISIVDAAGQDAYPIASFTWLLLPLKLESGDKRARLRSFLDWALTIGQHEAAGLGYIALPPALADQERAVVDRLWAQ